MTHPFLRKLTRVLSTKPDCDGDTSIPDGVRKLPVRCDVPSGLLLAIAENSHDDDELHDFINSRGYISELSTKMYTEMM